MTVANHFSWKAVNPPAAARSGPLRTSNFLSVSQSQTTWLRIGLAKTSLNLFNRE